MKVKARFVFLCSTTLCFIVTTLYFLKINVKPVDYQFIHTESKYGKLCIEENICKNSSNEQIYVYFREPDFYERVQADIDVNRNVINPESVVPDIVHYTWYEGLNKRNDFRFQHMLAIISAHRFTKPSRIYFWHEMLPFGNYWAELVERVPELCPVYRKAPREFRGKGVTFTDAVMDVIRLEAMLEYGGMYFDLDVMVLKSPHPLIKYDVTMGYESPNKLCSGVIIGKPWADFFKQWYEQYNSSKANDPVELPDVLAKQYPNLLHIEEISLNKPIGLDTDGLYESGSSYDWRRSNYAIHLPFIFRYAEQHVENIRTWNTSIGEIFRWIYYGDWRIQLPGCILGNICREHGSSKIFRYKRGLEFLGRIDTPLDLTSKTKHRERVVPSVVHFTWYGKGDMLRFHHLVAILSTQKFIRPDYILFWHDTLPGGRYWEELLEKVPQIVLVYRQAPTKLRGHALSGSAQLIDVICLESLLEYGGIYVGLDAIVLKSLKPLFKYDFTMGFLNDSELFREVIISKAWTSFLKILHRDYNKFPNGNISQNLGKLASYFAKKYPQLIHIEIKQMHRPSYEELDILYTDRKLFKWNQFLVIQLWVCFHEYGPRDINYWNTTSAEILRYIYYGDKRMKFVKETKGKVCIFGNLCKDKEYDTIWNYIQLPYFIHKVDLVVYFDRHANHRENVVPSIVHFTWYGGLKRGNTFRFHHLLSILAAYKFIKPEIILFWHDMVPTGPYWNEVNEKVPNINLVFRQPPSEIRGQTVRVPEHITDVVRLEAIMEYGGMYFDLDALVVKSLEPFLKFDVTMGYEHPVVHLCNGVMIGRAWAEFFRIWHREYETFDDSNWGYHSVVLPATLAQRHPNLVHTEETSMHRPNIQEFEWLFGIGLLHDWRRKNYVVHTFIRQHHVEHNATDIMSWNTTVGEIMRYIYYDDWRIMT